MLSVKSGINKHLLTDGINKKIRLAYFGDEQLLNNKGLLTTVTAVRL